MKHRRLLLLRIFTIVTDDNQPDNEVKIAVIHGGLFDAMHPGRLKPIKHETTQETGTLHKDGVLSMARLEPGSPPLNSLFVLEISLIWTFEEGVILTDKVLLLLEELLPVSK